MRLGDLDALKEKLSDKNYITYTHEYGDAIPVELVMNAIDNAPTIIWCGETSDGLPLMDLRPRPQGEWIPVSEKLPERNKEVIVTDIETKDTYCSWYHGNGYWECDNGVLKNRIIAWMPLPEPYKKG